jgi:hypothetical protein
MAGKARNRHSRRWRSVVVWIGGPVLLLTLAVIAVGLWMEHWRSPTRQRWSQVAVGDQETRVRELLGAPRIEHDAKSTSDSYYVEGEAPAEPFSCEMASAAIMASWCDEETAAHDRGTFLRPIRNRREVIPLPPRVPSQRARIPFAARTPSPVGAVCDSSKLSRTRSDLDGQRPSWLCDSRSVIPYRRGGTRGARGALLLTSARGADAADRRELPQRTGEADDRWLYSVKRASPRRTVVRLQ